MFRRSALAWGLWLPLARGVQQTLHTPLELAAFGRAPAAPGVLPDPKLPEKKYYEQLRATLLKACGETCEYTKSVRSGKYFPTVTKTEQCQTLFSPEAEVLDALSNRWPPPTQIPEAFAQDFAMGKKKMNVEKWFVAEKAASRPQFWSQEHVESLVSMYRANNMAEGSYSPKERQTVYKLLRKYKEGIKDKHCAVLGSQSPWVEAMLLAVGAARVTTIEYAEIQSQHPRLDAMRPTKWGNLYRNNGTEIFDCAVTFSSIEHSGLGRYGEVINPWADLVVMGKLLCSVKTDGLVFVGVPSPGQDRIAWNAHRYYGRQRWAQIMANTEQLDYIQPFADQMMQAMAVGKKI